MRRHEHVLDDDGVAAGATQTHDVPYIVDPVLGTRDQEAAEVDRTAVLDHGATEERPGGVVATRGPVPRTVDQVPAVDDDAGTHRRVRGGHPHVGVVTPHLFLRFLVEQGQVPVVHPDDRGDPTGGAAGTAQTTHRLVEGGGRGLISTPLRGLQQLEEADLLQFGDRGVRQTPQVLGLLRALAQDRQQVVNSCENRLNLVPLFGRRHCISSTAVVSISRHKLGLVVRDTRCTPTVVARVPC